MLNDVDAVDSLMQVVFQYYEYERFQLGVVYLSMDSLYRDKCPRDEHVSVYRLILLETREKKQRNNAANKFDLPRISLVFELFRRLRMSIFVRRRADSSIVSERARICMPNINMMPIEYQRRTITMYIVAPV